jgi:hypothetical protein
MIVSEMRDSDVKVISREGKKQSKLISGFGYLGVACWPLVPKFAGSNPAEAVGFFRVKKSSARLPLEGKQSHLSHVVDLRHVKDP